ncbi:MAG: hypothetical protein K2W96_04135 [Gemmataceae bacterium]|nr:hypothetical protein [Gemmataceae bacterium]
MTRAVLTFVLVGLMGAEPMPKKSAREALKPLHDLIGEWKGMGGPKHGSRDEREKGSWQEKIVWQWQFKGADAWLRADLSKGKHYSRLEIRPKGEGYELSATTLDKKTEAWPGKRDGTRLVFERKAEGEKRVERLVFSLLHSNRYLYRLESRAADSTVFATKYEVGATKQGVPFAVVGKGPECIVSGGLGTMTVSHKGKSYYVCCSGCRDAFAAEPEKYIKEYEENLKKAKE